MGCGHASYPPTAPHPLVDKPLPEIHHRSTLDGAAFEMAQLAGKPVVVKFFAEYCKPCQTTLPAAERIHQSHADVVFVGIDEDESASTARDLVQRHGLTFAVIHDASNVLAGRFRVREMPVTFVVDKQGIVRWVGDERQTEEDLTRAVEAAR
jgi:thiol-disulfide isomerase/thioredoxin